MRRQPFEAAPIVLGNDVWIGMGAIILPGVTIGDGAIVGAGAVVTSDVAPGTVVRGVPARMAKLRGSGAT
jgi:maltose O-acetyltransferase